MAQNDHKRWQGRYGNVENIPEDSTSRLLPPPLSSNVVVANTNNQPQYTEQAYHTAVKNQAHLPPLPPGYECYAPQVFNQPMVTYHVCRICLRPRSDRYHREHPIAPQSVPPPPGICRRCRVTGINEQADNEGTTHIERSDPVRLGLDCILPEAAVLTQRQVTEETLGGQLRQHLRVTTKVRRSSFSKDDTAQDRKTRVEYRYVPPHKVSESRTLSKACEVSAENLQVLDTVNMQRGGLTTSNASERNNYQRDHRGKAVSRVIPPEAAIQQPNNGLDNPKSRPSYSESEIRRFARDEVVRYRQAERLVDAHPGPYAHGRLLPMQNQIEEPAITGHPSHEQMADQTIPLPIRATSSTKVKALNVERESVKWQLPDQPFKISRTARVSEEHKPASIESKQDARRDSATRVAVAMDREERDVMPASLLIVSRVHTDDTDQDNLTDYRGKSTSALAENRRSPIVVRSELDALVDVDSPAAELSHAPSKHMSSGKSTRIVSAQDVINDRSAHSSTWTDREYWMNDGTVQATRRHPDRTLKQIGRGERVLETPQSGADGTDSAQKALSRRPDQGSHHTCDNESIQDKPRQLSTLSAEGDRSWYEARTKRSRLGQASGRHHQATEEERKTQQDDFRHQDPQVKPNDAAADSRTNKFEYEYRERTIQPAERPAGQQPFEEDSPMIIQDFETLYTYRPKLSAHSSQPSGGKISETRQHVGRPRGTAMSPAPSTIKSSVRTGRANSNHLQTMDTLAHDGNKFTQVRFANQVNFSDTPPASDDYPPAIGKRSEQRRSERRQSQAGFAMSYDVEIGQQQPREANGQRGRMLERDTRAVPPQDQRSQASIPGRSHRQDGRLPAEDTATTLQTESRQLSRALCESPSREKAMLEIGKRETRRHSPNRRTSSIDAYGPYRQVTRDESLEAICGSSRLLTKVYRKV